MSPEQDTLRPLLPWLDDPAWVGTPDHYDRMGFLDSFGEVRLPEAIPRLERALSNKTDSWETARIAYALAFHQAQHAVPAMKAALAGCEGSACASIVSSIQSLGGFSQDEIFGAVEHFFITCPSDENRQDVVFDREDSPKDPRIWIGACFIDEPPWNQQWFDKLSSRVIETVSRQPAPASGLLDLMLLMKKGDVSPAAAALLAPQQLSAWQLERILPRVSKPGWNPVPFRPLLGKKGALGGFAAVLASDRKSIDAILEGDDVMALRAVLAAASLVKGAVTPQQVLPLLGSKEEEVASAAVEYLRYGDREARRAFLLHKRATAGGDDVSWDPEKGNYGEYQKTVGRAMDQFNLPTGPDEVFELSQTAQGGIRGNWTVLGYKDSGIVFHEERGGRSGFAKLDKERMERFRDYVTRYRVDELPPLVQPIMDGVNFAYTHTRGENSSRVFMNNPPGTDPSLEPSAMVPTGKERYSKGIVVYGGLVNLFDILLEELPFTWAFGGVGEEVLVPREKAEIVSVWKQDDDLRVLVWDRMGVRYWMGVDPDTRSLTGLVAPPFLPATEWYVDRYSRKLTRLDPEKPTNTYDLPLRTLQSSSEGGLWIVDGESIYESTGSGIRPTTGIFRLSPTESRGRPLASIRGLNLASEATWVDEAEGMVYAAVDGNLVRIPVRF
ncbi:MAG: hypothetical protein EOP87_06745 [Verrucomicrobiaceae bacterium]|nr:MAG: hypothetical protein EOP87_06745 [Verrucomicrobiaceae bacterium]